MSRCAVVTGASQGVGLSITQLLLEHGWTVYAHYRTTPAPVDHPNVHWWQADFSQNLPTEAISRLTQIGPIDALIHCAGVASLGKVSTVERRDWELHMSVNLHAPVELTAALLPQIRSASGHVVYINSGAGMRTNPHWGAYSASKFAAGAWCDALRHEEPMICVTSVFPGRIDTGMQRGIVKQEGGVYNGSAFIAPASVAKVVLTSLETTADAHIPEIIIRPR
ncbi:SDR family oxidoreductase [Corynebacterium pseudotuberculosis]|uniref:SDR family oxidoreductase n=1 Tax=Corynebacterium pseudotuberculosis TaxID=1719 RepID=UPI0004D1BE6D|nr:SDR family oxidoreductase [Corynebacterium pseudotuberculosis]AIG11038.1 3-oxoacyl-[acyl-carrier protein] reductase [Corynebacterium pseudotuberculosis]